MAFANAVKFSYDDTDLGGNTVIHWHTGENVDSAVWITVCLVVVVAINLFPAKVSIQGLCHVCSLDTAADSNYSIRFTVSWNTFLAVSS